MDDTEELTVPKRRRLRSLKLATDAEKRTNDFEFLQSQFYLPITIVAKNMGVCTTVVKKLCRRHGIMRWPRRQLVALEASIEHLKMKPYASTEERDTIAAKLEAAKQTRHLLLTTGNGPQKSIKQLRRATTKLRSPNKSAPNPQNLLLLAQIATESSPDAANPTKTLP